MNLNKKRENREKRRKDLQETLRGFPRTVAIMADSLCASMHTRDGHDDIHTPPDAYSPFGANRLNEKIAHGKKALRGACKEAGVDFDEVYNLVKNAR